MSVIYKGNLLESDLTKKSKGGTEQMRNRLLHNVNSELLEKVAIHFSRPKEIFNDVPNILYLHDLAEDPAISILEQGHGKFDHFVFVSYWQRDQFINRFNLPYSKCTVIQNAIETTYDSSMMNKPNDKIRFIYHTTPHRGLELLYPVFDMLSEYHKNIHLDVYSSFSIYGWEQRDQPYKPLFDKIKNHPNMEYHGAKPNEEVLSALRDAHVFLYPSIWKETNCIALIEAMHSGCLCIYPSYGALPETGSVMNNIGMYEYSEDLNQNASNALNLTHSILNEESANSGFIHSTVALNFNENPHYTIPYFKSKWETLLHKVVDK